MKTLDKKILVSKFATIKSVAPVSQVDILEWLCSPSVYSQDVLAIRSTEDVEKRKELKSKLPAITPSGIFSKRNTDGLIKHSGLICIDIDGKDNPHITDFEDLKLKVYENFPVFYCGLSVGGSGIFCLIKISHSEKHKGHFNALERDFKSMGVVIDKSCSDITRLRLYSVDNRPYINENALVYDLILENSIRVSHSKSKHERNEVVESQSNSLSQQWDKESLKQCLLKPTYGHVQVLVKSKTEQVRDLINRVLDSKIDITNDYSNWITICSVIKNLFDEEGRQLFHEISSFYPGYSFEETDWKYSSISKGQYLYRAEELFKIAAKHGVS